MRGVTPTDAIGILNGIWSARLLTTPTALNVGGQDHDTVMVMHEYRYSKRHLERPIADNSDRPECGRSRPRHGHGHALV